MNEFKSNGITFVVGNEYRNRQGKYKVLEIKPPSLKVQFGTEIKEINLEIAARIATNLQCDDIKTTMGIHKNSSQENFAYTIGIIAAKGNLSAEVGYYSYDGFMQKYYHITGCSENIPNVFRCAQTTHKPGCELRIEIEKELTLLDRFHLPDDVRPVTDKYGSTTINKNSFWWHLIEKLGFRLCKKQNPEIISTSLPENIRSHFWDGYNWSLTWTKK